MVEAELQSGRYPALCPSGNELLLSMLRQSVLLLKENLQNSLPAIALGAHTSLISAVANDLSPECI
jgi:hypothetical protein